MKILEYSDRVQVISKALVSSTPSTTPISNGPEQPSGMKEKNIHILQPLIYLVLVTAKDSKKDFDSMAKIVLSESDEKLGVKTQSKSLDNSIFHQGRVYVVFRNNRPNSNEIRFFTS